MSQIPKPATQKEQIDQLWWTIIGSNGDGLATKVKETRAEVKEIRETLPTLMTREEYRQEEDRRQQAIRSGRNRRKVSVREWALIIATALALVPAYVSIFHPVEKVATTTSATVDKR